MASLPCDDYTQFKAALTKLRAVDDFVIQRLNTVIPTDTFKNVDSVEKKHSQCDALYKQLQGAYAERRAAIKHCVQKMEKEVDGLRTIRSKDRDNEAAADNLSEAHMKLRFMQNELPIESVIEERSMKAFRERCNTYEILQAE